MFKFLFRIHCVFNFLSLFSWNKGTYTSPSTKSPSTNLFEHVVSLFDFIWLCHIIRDAYSRTLNQKILTCQVWVNVLHSGYESIFEQYISVISHIPSASRLCVKNWCQYHLCGCYWSNMTIQPNLGSHWSPNNMINIFVKFLM